MDENNNAGPDAKRLKSGDINDVNGIIDEKIKSRNKDFSSLRNKLQSHLSHQERVTILEENDQFIPTDANKVFSSSNSVFIHFYCLLFTSNFGCCCF